MADLIAIGLVVFMLMFVWALFKAMWKFGSGVHKIVDNAAGKVEQEKAKKTEPEPKVDPRKIEPGMMAFLYTIKVDGETRPWNTLQAASKEAAWTLAAALVFAGGEPEHEDSLELVVKGAA